MAKFKIKYEALEVNQPDYRYIGRSVDAPLPQKFWEYGYVYSSSYVIGVVDDDDLPWSSVETVELSDGFHYIIMSTSADAGAKWKVKIMIKDYYSGATLISAESDVEVDRNNQFYLSFKVSGASVEKVSSGLIEPGTAPSNPTDVDQGDSSTVKETPNDIMSNLGNIMSNMMGMVMNMMMMMAMMQMMVGMMSGMISGIGGALAM